MEDEAELPPYEIAYLFGGPERVAMVALAGMCADGRIEISPDRHRVYAVRRESHDDVEAQVFEVVGEVGRVLGLTVLMIASSAAVARVGGELRTKNLLPDSRLTALWQWRRLKAARGTRRRLAEKEKGTEGPARVAVMGAAGIADDSLREIFETHVYKPPVHVKLTHPRRDGPYDSLPGYSPPDRSADLYIASQIDGGPL